MRPIAPPRVLREREVHQSVDPCHRPHACAIWVGNAKRPHQWQAAIAQEQPDGAGRIEHWLGAVHRTPDLAIRQAQAQAHTSGAPQ